ncbi:MAG TPA: hypothetical protein VME43_10710 [Bryobacteraceae bacterium]|nr:hypothetical protein [Bryobacteraceae bacterium]
MRFSVESGGWVDGLAFHEDSRNSIYWWLARLFQDCMDPADDGAVTVQELFADGQAAPVAGEYEACGEPAH